jgi:hypothetical protein
MIAYNTDIFNQYPPDLAIPVTCDKITQLMAQALGDRIRSKTLDYSRRVSMTRVRANWATWSNQISTAVANDPDGPTISKMQDEQRKLDAHLTASLAKAARDASSAVGSSPAPATTLSFAAPPATVSFAAPASTVSFAPATTTFAPRAATISFPTSTLSTQSFPSQTFSSQTFPSFAAPATSSSLSTGWTPFVSQPTTFTTFGR